MPVEVGVGSFGIFFSMDVNKGYLDVSITRGTNFDLFGFHQKDGMMMD